MVWIRQISEDDSCLLSWYTPPPPESCDVDGLEIAERAQAGAILFAQGLRRDAGSGPALAQPEPQHLGELGLRGDPLPCEVVGLAGVGGEVEEVRPVGNQCFAVADEVLVARRPHHGAARAGVL